MKYITKISLSLLLIVSLIGYLVDAYIELEQNTLKNELGAMLKSACNDATSQMKENQLDGFMTVDKELVLKRFMDTLQINYSGKFNYHIPVRGIVGYRGVQICKHDDTWFPLVPYSYYVEKDRTIYIFSLNEDLTIKYLDTGASIKTKISDVSSPFTNMTMEEFKDLTIMATINQEVTKVLSSEDNLVARNHERGLELNLESFDNDYGNIVRDIGFFAVMDGMMFRDKNRRIRIARINGSELRER